MSYLAPCQQVNSIQYPPLFGLIKKNNTARVCVLFGEITLGFTIAVCDESPWQPRLNPIRISGIAVYRCRDSLRATWGAGSLLLLLLDISFDDVMR